MAKLNKKEIKGLARKYKFFIGEEHSAMVRVLVEINKLEEVQEQVIRDKVGKIENEKLDEIKRIIKINFKKFDVSMLDHYLYDVDFMKLSNEDKRLLKANIESFNRYFAEKTGMTAYKYLVEYLETNRDH